VSCAVCFCRNLLNPATNTESVELVVGRSLTEADRMANVKQFDEDAETAADSTSIQRGLMGDDRYYSDIKPVHGWTPKSLLESSTLPQIQDDVVSSGSEATLTGGLHWMVH